MAEPVVVSWSGGKDSAFALYEVLKNREYEVTALLTTVTEEYDRISIHGVRSVLLERQAASLNLPLRVVHIPKDCTNAEYESRMVEALTPLAWEGVRTVVAGDIFLTDVREYREQLLAGVGMRGVFPLWGRDTARLARSFVGSGFRAVTSCVDSHVLDSAFVGRVFDEEFLADLPSGADPCGENGEFHSFVFDGPLFREKVPCAMGEIVLRDAHFYYCDLLPADVGDEDIVS